MDALQKEHTKDTADVHQKLAKDSHNERAKSGKTIKEPHG